MQDSGAIHGERRQLLMRCEVTSGQGYPGERFVDHTEFLLWRYLLEARHGLQVAHPSPCIWVPEGEYRRHDKLFSHAAFHAPVTKLTFRDVDEQTGIVQTRIRFTLSSDLHHVSDVLAGHLGGCSEAATADTQAGEAISTAPAKRLFRLRPSAAYCAA